jgi:hypothetical protein
MWDCVQDAIVAKKVEKQSAALVREFDERLEARVQEALTSCGRAHAMLKVKAQREALKVKNTIMKLCCPHCLIAFAEFTGCVALEWQTCLKSFCAFCHFKAATSLAAHDHVREYHASEISHGTYYASPEEIARAQRLCRTREIQICLRQHKKTLQNAIVIELVPDLNDIGIRPGFLCVYRRRSARRGDTVSGSRKVLT